MAVPDYVKLKGFTNIGDTLLLTELENNLREFLDFGLLNKGGWFDVEIPTSGEYGGDFSVLRLAEDESYTPGQVWESARKDWVWQSGVEFIDEDDIEHEPIQVSGVYIDGVFKTFDDADYPHHINFPLGRVVFDEAIPTDSVVQAEYSYKYIQVYKANDVPWFQELQYNSFRVDDSHFQEYENGSWSIGGQHRIQMPCIILEAVPRGSSRGYELGSNTLIVSQDVLLHILAESKEDRNKLVSCLMLQNDKAIKLFDSNAIANDEAFPLDYRGMLVDNPKMYPELVDTYTFHVCRLVSTTVSEIQSLTPKLHEGTVRMTLEVILADI